MKLLITVSGGSVTGVYVADCPVAKVDVLLHDYDNLDYGDDSYGTQDAPVTDDEFDRAAKFEDGQNVEQFCALLGNGNYRELDIG